VEGVTEALLSCGQVGGSFPKNSSEEAALRGLRRGVYAKREIGESEVVKDSDVFFAIPLLESQVSANDWSKYLQVRAPRRISSGAPLMKNELLLNDSHEKVDLIVQRSRELFSKSRVVLPSKSHLEISHHYGLERFDEFGLVMITVVNREYCKKILGVFPSQSHPEQWHNSKEETFNCLYGELELRLDGEWMTLKPGDSVVVQPGVRHFFTTKTGCVFEEISSTHQVMDSFYTDDTIMDNRERKTFVGFWS
jgi:quercetin dioxygenase-like cupin family protein